MRPTPGAHWWEACTSQVGGLQACGCRVSGWALRYSVEAAAALAGRAPGAAGVPAVGLRLRGALLCSRLPACHTHTCCCRRLHDVHSAGPAAAGGRHPRHHRTLQGGCGCKVERLPVGGRSPAVACFSCQLVPAAPSAPAATANISHCPAWPRCSLNPCAPCLPACPADDLPVLPQHAPAAQARGHR
jgi:hypothetical protein